MELVQFRKPGQHGQVGLKGLFTCCMTLWLESSHPASECPGDMGLNPAATGKKLRQLYLVWSMCNSRYSNAVDSDLLSQCAGLKLNEATCVQELPTYVQDTTHAIHLLQDFQFPSPQHLAFTVDIQSLPNQSPFTDTIIRLTELILTLNNFSFNSFHFLQTKGVAMGTRMGPSYACPF
eukprot:g35246.t1